MAKVDFGAASGEDGQAVAIQTDGRVLVVGRTGDDFAVARLSGGGTRTYAVQDANFNVTAVTDATGKVLERYQYDPHGAVTVLNADFTTDADGKQDVSQPYLWQGAALVTATGVYHFRHRDVDPRLGRPTQADPLGYPDGMSRYAWEGSNPVKSLDPLGLFTSYLTDWVAENVAEPVAAGVANQMRNAGLPGLADGYETAANAAIGFGREATRQLDVGRSIAEAAADPAGTYEGIRAGVEQKIEDTGSVYDEFGFGAAVAEATGMSGIAEGAYNADLVTGQPVGDGWDRFMRIGEGVQGSLEVAAAVGGAGAGLTARAARATTYTDPASVARITEGMRRGVPTRGCFVAGTPVLIAGPGDTAALGAASAEPGRTSFVRDACIAGAIGCVVAGVGGYRLIRRRNQGGRASAAAAPDGLESYEAEPVRFPLSHNPAFSLQAIEAR